MTRLDGAVKSTARARYGFDQRPEGVIFAKVLRCPHAHARVRSIDVAAARKVPGVAALRVVHEAGSEVQWALDEIAYVAAETPEAAEDAVRAIRVDYEVLPHSVSDEADAPGAEAGDERTVGDPEAAFARDDVVISSGRYGIEAAAHCCLEPHGQVVDWSDGDELTGWFSTQAVTAVRSQVAEALEIDASKVRVLAPYIGGGFGSKFSPDSWGIECARLSRDAKRPVSLFLDREAELAVAGDRPSVHADVRVAATRDGKVVGWHSRSWGTGGVQGSSSPPIPYVLSPPNVRHEHVSVPTNRAPARAWRAPNHPQACHVTLAALDDLAAALKLDPVELLRRNLDLTGPRERTYREQLEIAERLSDWKARWHPRGQAGKGRIRRGLGVSLHTWGGRGHRSTCEVLLHPDGLAEARLASQDIGTGTRTVIAIVLAETLGLPLDQVRVSIGDSNWPPSGGSGGSTTVGGVSASTRRAALAALDAIFAKAAAELDADGTDLEAVDGTIRVRGDASRALPWKRAVSLVARVTPFSVTGSNPGPGELTDSGVGGVQVAEVAVDVDTGVVRVERMVAVQDCGLVVDTKTARSQVEGGLIMGISTALTEEKIYDPTTGRLLNGDMESYRLATIGDIGELVVHLQQDEHHVKRGVIGLGEPPVISPVAAIGNAVANAIGHRVGHAPFTPDRVVAVLDREGVS